MAKKKELSYFEQRMKEMGVDPKSATLTWKGGDKQEHVFHYFEEVEDAAQYKGKFQLKAAPKDLKPGDVIINYPEWSGQAIQAHKVGRKTPINFHRLRFANPSGDMKYYTIKGLSSQAFIPPNLHKKYQDKTPIKTLVITEGEFKAFVGDRYGLDVVGIGGIYNMKNRETETLNTHIAELIKRCSVKNVVFLVDGDAKNMSSKWSLTPEDQKEKIDLYRRPYQFFRAVQNFKRLLEDFGLNITFAAIDPESLDKERNDKGLDDLLLAARTIATERKQDPDTFAANICAELNNVSGKSAYFEKMDISGNLISLRKWFKISSPDDFYQEHEKRIGHVPFKFNGTVYQYDDQEGKLRVKINGDVSKYFRVNNDYYKWVDVPNKHGLMERIFVGRNKGTILDDHGKGFVQQIAKHETFCNVPDHDNHQKVINNCYNIYHPFDWEPDPEGDCSLIIEFVKHIFGTGTVKWKDNKTGHVHKYNEYDLGLDYLQLLYKRPTQMLPILCLVSKEKGTGKSTFGMLLKAIFSQNMAIVGNADLENEFNGAWATKLIVECEEVFLDRKKVIERLKQLATGDKILMNQKGKDQVEMDFFAKFILNSNNEESFIYTDQDETRFWVRKIAPIPAENRNVDMLDQMIEEIPAFLNFLSQRKMVTENRYRAWFDPALIKTNALMKVVEYSRSTLEKEVRDWMKDIFLSSEIQEIKMTAKDLKQEILSSRFESNYVNKTMASMLDADRPLKTERYKYPKYAINPNTSEFELAWQDSVGRPWTFKRKDILSEEEMDQEIDKSLDILSRLKGDEVVPEGAEPAPTAEKELDF